MLLKAGADTNIRPHAGPFRELRPIELVKQNSSDGPRLAALLQQNTDTRAADAVADSATDEASLIARFDAIMQKTADGMDDEADAAATGDSAAKAGLMPEWEICPFPDLDLLFFFSLPAEFCLASSRGHRRRHAWQGVRGIFYWNHFRFCCLLFSHPRLFLPLFTALALHHRVAQPATRENGRPCQWR